MASPDHSATPQDSTRPSYGKHSTPGSAHPVLEQLPVAITRGPFVNYKTRPKANGKLDKIPLDPNTADPFDPAAPLRHADMSDPDTWGTYDQAVANLARAGVAGLSRAMTLEDDVVGLDWDDCVEPATGVIDPAVLAEISGLGCYAEISRSGRGVRGFTRGHLPVDGRKKGQREVYQAKRHLTVTGRHIAGTPLILEVRQAALDAWYLAHFGPPPTRRERVTPATVTRLDDQDLLTKARAAKNGPKFSGLYDQAPPADDPRASEDDQALANELAFWTQDPAQLRRLLEGSARRRSKWYTRRGAGDWLDLTIAKALADVRETYQGGRLHAPIPLHPPAPQATAPAAVTCASCPYTDRASRVAQLEARVAQLEGLLADERRAHRQLEQVHSGLVGALNNKHVKQEARTAFAVASHIKSLAARGKATLDAPTPIYLPEVAKDAGCSDKQLSKHLDRLHTWGVVEKRTRTEVVPDQDGRPRRITRVTVQVPALAAGQGLAGVMQPLAHLVPSDIAAGERVGWGQRKGCPDHPNARVLRRWADICEECGQILHDGERVVVPGSAEAAGPPAAPVDGSHFRPSDDPVPNAEPEPVPPTPASVESVLKAEVTSVQDSPVPPSAERCSECDRPPLPNGQPSCVHRVAGGGEWPRLEVPAVEAAPPVGATSTDHLTLSFFLQRYHRGPGLRLCLADFEVPYRAWCAERGQPPLEGAALLALLRKWNISATPSATTDHVLLDGIGLKSRPAAVALGEVAS